jgi:hypothetical protein
MTAFDVSQTLTSQGAKKHEMALVLESLHNERMLPTWGSGETGAELSPRQVVSVILGATSAAPEEAARHTADVACLIRNDGLCLGEILTKIITAPACDIQVEEITVSVDSQVATIRYTTGLCETFSTGHGLKAFRPATIIRGSLLQALAMKANFPTTSGWVEP